MSRKHTPGKKPYYGEGDANPYRKYRAQRVTIDGHSFASKMEGRRYKELKDLVKSGEIRDLELQPRYRIEDNGIKICDYIADFRYTVVATGEQVVEDVKGALTPVYRIKRNLMLSKHGITILETQA